jgi:CDP-glycerol glycerophosphotransferase (TagB/SpsB family)
MRCDKLIASSEISKETYKEAFYLSFKEKNIDDKILISGQPRNDVLKQDFNFEKRLFPELPILESYRDKYSKIVSWLPTHRMQLNKTIICIMDESKFDLNTLDKFYKENNILFIIKAHFLELDLIKDLINSCSNIITYDIADPYPLLHFTDILITDYSSVYFDFLVTNKPIIFAPFDLQEYKDTVKFYYDYYEITPGKKCMNWKEIGVEVENIINDVDVFKQDRDKLLSGGNFIVDDNSRNIINYFM